MTVWVPSYVPGPDGREGVADGVRRWLGNPDLWELVRLFGGRPPQSIVRGDARSVLDWLERFAGEFWDFRAGGERNQARVADLGLRQRAAVVRVAESVGMLPSTPHEQSVDAVVMTGGMVRAGLVKPRFVRSLIAGGLRARSVVFVGAHRGFVGDEARLARELGISGGDEVDAMTEGMRSVFGLSAEPEVTTWGSGNARGTTVVWPGFSSRFEVVAAPSGDPAVRRAHTRDTFEHWARMSDARSVLVVTTPVYVPYQAACAVEVLGLGHGMRVHTVGVDAASNDLGKSTQVFGQQQQLQELRSAVRGIRSLNSTLEQRVAGA